MGNSCCRGDAPVRDSRQPITHQIDYMTNVSLGSKPSSRASTPVSENGATVVPQLQAYNSISGDSNSPATTPTARSIDGSASTPTDDVEANSHASIPSASSNNGAIRTSMNGSNSASSLKDANGSGCISVAIRRSSSSTSSSISSGHANGAHSQDDNESATTTTTTTATTGVVPMVPVGKNNSSSNSSSSNNNGSTVTSPPVSQILKRTSSSVTSSSSSSSGASSRRSSSNPTNIVDQDEHGDQFVPNTILVTTRSTSSHSFSNTVSSTSSGSQNSSNASSRRQSGETTYIVHPSNGSGSNLNKLRSKRKNEGTPPSTIASNSVDAAAAAATASTTSSTESPQAVNGRQSLSVPPTPSAAMDQLEIESSAASSTLRLIPDTPSRYPYSCPASFQDRLNDSAQGFASLSTAVSELQSSPGQEGLLSPVSPVVRAAPTSVASGARHPRNTNRRVSSEATTSDSQPSSNNTTRTNLNSNNNNIIINNNNDSEQQQDAAYVSYNYTDSSVFTPLYPPGSVPSAFLQQTNESDDGNSNNSSSGASSRSGSCVYIGNIQSSSNSLVASPASAALGSPLYPASYPSSTTLPPPSEDIF